jgi:hypothetical protein
MVANKIGILILSCLMFFQSQSCKEIKNNDDLSEVVDSIKSKEDVVLRLIDGYNNDVKLVWENFLLKNVVHKYNKNLYVKDIIISDEDVAFVRLLWHQINLDHYGDNHNFTQVLKRGEEDYFELEFRNESNKKIKLIIPFDLTNPRYIIDNYPLKDIDESLIPFSDDPAEEVIHSEFSVWLLNEFLDLKLKK